MKRLVFRILFLLFFSTNVTVIAQETLSISGVVVDEKQNPVKDATVFISGSKRITATNDEGKFNFAGIAAGNYQISTKMLGYEAPSMLINVLDKSVNLVIRLEIKTNMLRDVVIGTDKNRESYLAIFKDQFLGTSSEARKSIILNPEVLYFTKKTIGEYNLSLVAESDELLIVKNEQLGYRIRYLLKDFTYDSKTRITYYQGDSNFEELVGNSEEKKKWAENRAKAYYGSLMHYLRSVYANSSVAEGFITNQMVKSRNSFDRKLYMMPNPISFDTLVTKIDSSFISFKFTALNVAYNPKKLARIQKREVKRQEQGNDKEVSKKSTADDLQIADPTGENSQLFLSLKEAIIDARGSALEGARTFLIRGIWANKRIGDQLPFEYRPPN